MLIKIPDHISWIETTHITEIWWRRGKNWDSATGEAKQIEEMPGFFRRIWCKIWGLPIPAPTWRDRTVFDPYAWAPCLLIRFNGRHSPTEYEFDTPEETEAAFNYVKSFCNFTTPQEENSNEAS